MGTVIVIVGQFRSNSRNISAVTFPIAIVVSVAISNLLKRALIC